MIRKHVCFEVATICMAITDYGTPESMEEAEKYRILSIAKEVMNFIK